MQPIDGVLVEQSSSSPWRRRNAWQNDNTGRQANTISLKWRTRKRAGRWLVTSALASIHGLVDCRQVVLDVARSLQRQWYFFYAPVFLFGRERLAAVSFSRS